MKILFVTNMYPTPEFPNDGIFIKEQIEFCHQKYGFDYEVFLINRNRKKYFKYARSLYSINRLIAQKKFDLVHIHFGLSGLFLLVNPFLKIPCIVTLHGSDVLTDKKGGLLKAVSKSVVSRVSFAIIMNDKMAEILKDFSHKLIKIPCGINLETFRLGRENLKNETFRIGFPSSKDRKVKNYPFFEKVVNTLISQNYSIEVIEFRNFTRKQVAENLSQLDCLMMTSHSEGSPQIIKEAMTSGVPIISSDVGDVSVLLEGVRNSFVIRSFSVGDYVEKVIEIMELSPDERRTDGNAKIITLGLDQDTVSDQIIKLYRELTTEY